MKKNNYIIINKSEFLNGLSSIDRNDRISNSNKNLIERVFNPLIFKIQFDYLLVNSNTRIIHSTNIRYFDKLNTANLYEINIFAFPDEWYYISYLTNDKKRNVIETFYKCDQIDGFTECLIRLYNEIL